MDTLAEIERFMLEQFKEHEIPDTTDNRIEYLAMVLAAAEKRDDGSIKHTFYMLSVSQLLLEQRASKLI